jgi:Cyclin
MSIVQGFFIRIKKYLDKGVILSMPASGNLRNFFQFLQAMFELMNFSEECFTCMAIYFDRLISRHNSLINESNMTRLIFMSGVLAIKVYDDFCCTNTHFAQASGIPKHELKALEHDFLKWIEYSLMISSEEYKTYYDCLTNHKFI